MRVVIALGGHADADGEVADLAGQRDRVAAAAAAIAAVAQEHHEVVVAHGTGPQRALLGQQCAQATDRTLSPLELVEVGTDGLGAALLERELRAAMPGRPIATVFTHAVVDPSDPAFRTPTELVGPVYAPVMGELLRAGQGWTMLATADGLRRAVATPAPVSIVGFEAVELLARAGTLVVCAGGGGIPVTLGPDGRSEPADAIVDPDLTAVRLAESLDADRLVFLTEVDGVMLEVASGHVPVAGELDVERARGLHRATGAMAATVEAACRFVDATRRPAAIGALRHAPAVVAGTSGTQIVAASNVPAFR
jgi:carbamate kinase